MGEFSGFGLVASKCGDLRLKRVGDVDENVGTKYRFDALEGPLGGGRYLEGIDIAHALPTHRPRRCQYGAVDDPMVDIQVSRVVRVNRIGAEAGHQIFDYLHNIKQRNGIESIVRQLAKGQLFRSYPVGSLLSA